MGRNRKEWTKVPKEGFTDEEIALIKKYCDERIVEINSSPIKSIWYIRYKEQLKEKVDDIEHMSIDMWEDMYLMVWNREYLDNRKNELNRSILKKLEGTDYYIKKVKNYERTQKIYNSKQKLKYKKKKQKNK